MQNIVRYALMTYLFSMFGNSRSGSLEGKEKQYNLCSSRKCINKITKFSTIIAIH